MHSVRISAELPFPVRVNPTPYQVRFAGAVWTLTFERVQQTNPDERIAGSGTTNIDLNVDRAGQLAYSRVTGQPKVEVAKELAFQQFLGALNLFISHVRDVFREYWIRPLEPRELYRVQIEINGSFSSHWTPGPGEGLTLAVVGRTEEANARLVAAIESGEAPPVWRHMHLDARDALSLGRDEDCIVLAWSALEAACRQALPGMAYRAGLSIADLANRLGAPNRRQKPPFSYEEAVERVSGGLKIVEVAAELTVPQIYDPQSISGSVELAYRLRNRIVHQGVRVYHRHAQQVWESVDFVLERALALRNVEPPPATISWKQRFGSVRRQVEQFAASNALRLVLAHPRAPFFEMQLIGNELWLRFAYGMPQSLASAFMLVMWDSWRRCLMDRRARLIEGPPSGILVAGWVSYLVEAVNTAVCFAEAVIAASTTTAALKIAKYGSSRIVTRLAGEPTFDPNNAGQIIESVRLASYLAVLSKRSVSARLRLLQRSQPNVARLARRWAEIIASMDPDDDHCRCSVLRTIHADAFWLDTIWVSCPTEGVTYGSQRRPLNLHSA